MFGTKSHIYCCVWNITKFKTNNYLNAQIHVSLIQFKYLDDLFSVCSLRYVQQLALSLWCFDNWLGSIFLQFAFPYCGASFDLCLPHRQKPWRQSQRDYFTNANKSSVNPQSKVGATWGKELIWSWSSSIVTRSSEPHSCTEIWFICIQHETHLA